MRVEPRLAYTTGCEVVSSADGMRRRIPPGACWIARHAEAEGSTVRWNELGTEHAGHLSSAELRGYILGCRIQYA
jgi:hypothetical protein